MSPFLAVGAHKTSQEEKDCTLECIGFNLSGFSGPRTAWIRSESQTTQKLLQDPGGPGGPCAHQLLDSSGEPLGIWTSSFWCNVTRFTSNYCYHLQDIYDSAAENKKTENPFFMTHDSFMKLSHSLSYIPHFSIAPFWDPTVFCCFLVRIACRAHFSVSTQSPYSCYFNETSRFHCVAYFSFLSLLTFRHVAFPFLLLCVLANKHDSILTVC